jgi:hypothetical protein
VAAMDPVRWEPAYRRRVIEGLEGEADEWVVLEAEAERAIQAERAKHPRALRELARLSGLQHSTVLKAIPPLLVSGAGLLVSGPGPVAWYGHQLHRVEEYAPEELNHAATLTELRAWRFNRALPHNFTRDPREWLARAA